MSIIVYFTSLSVGYLSQKDFSSERVQHLCLEASSMG